MWYVLQTFTGNEQRTVDVIDRILDRSCYERCFLIRHECIWRLEGRLKLHTEPLFPSYVFVETDTPVEFFHALKRVPKVTRLLGGEGTFWTVEHEEEEWLRVLLGGDEELVIRRCPVKVNDQGEIIWAGGALKEYLDRIVKKRLRKRYVTVELPFLGEMRRIRLGICLEGDDKG